MNITRRDFLKRAWQGATALVVTSMGYVAWRYFDSRTAVDQSGQTVTVGSPETFPLNSVTPFPEAKFFLVRTADGGFLALSRQCTHLACTVLWQEGKFRCPCHGSEFEQTGQVVNAPASNALWRYQITIENDRLIVDTRHKLESGANPSDDFVYITKDRT